MATRSVCVSATNKVHKTKGRRGAGSAAIYTTKTPMSKGQPLTQGNIGPVLSSSDGLGRTPADEQTNRKRMKCSQPSSTPKQHLVSTSRTA